LDKDKDGKLVKEELPERMQSFFDALDTNKDGGVTASELAEARKKMQQARPEQGAPGGPGGPSAGGQ
jgi:Ca2+-binding EF-hand superfamily protein